MVEPQWKIENQNEIIDLYKWSGLTWVWVDYFNSYEDALDYLKGKNNSPVVHYYDGGSNLLRGYDGPRS